jgi:dolichol kinase
LTGASTFWIGLYFLFILFPRDVFLPVASVMVFSDALAAIFGKNFAIHTFSNGKTVGGFGVFIISTMLIFRYANIPLFLILPIAIILGVVEFFWGEVWRI